jgi:hypothetical protein
MYRIKKNLKQNLPKIVKEYGYGSERLFIEDALRRLILDLKKNDFLTKIHVIRNKMKRKRINEDEILKDFDKFTTKNEHRHCC